MVRDP